MSCECAQCRQHYRTLGIAFGIPEESTIEEAYREGIKQWDPDLYVDYASLRADAEEHYKQIQVAYRELKEHNTVAVAAVEEVRRPSGASASAAPQQEAVPAISFGGAPGSQTAPNFTPEVEEIISTHLGKLGPALGIVDLSGARARANYAQFFLLANKGMMVRDARHLITLLWYTDLGDVTLIDKQKQGNPGFWQKMVDGGAGGSGSVLQIGRNNGTLFLAMGPQVDDGVKKTIYQFLLSKKEQKQP